MIGQKCPPALDKLAEDTPTLVGIDHGFSFPLRYFEAHGLKPDWPVKFSVQLGQFRVAH